MINCDNCMNTFKEKEVTAVTPSEYLGHNFPAIVRLCPNCLQVFLDKIKKIRKDTEDIRLSNLRSFIIE